MHNATEAAIVEDSQENIDSITTEKVESSTTTEQIESITTTKFENITTQTTQTSTTTARSTLCVDQDFECCPDGKTYAKGSDFEGCNTTVARVPSTGKASSHTFAGVCELEKDAGSCSKYVNMWAYDRQQGKCVRFWYGNCEGNGNRFETEQQCQETCISPKGIGKDNRFFFSFRFKTNNSYFFL
ncbi:unnamed protein product [Rotaria magnacalcarata]|nr:unnamed protein product [Rotaria magnacalcarata]